MKKLIILSFPLALLISCTSKTSMQTETANEVTVKKTTKLETLLSLSQDTFLDRYDLSNDSLSVFPDLSKYSIRYLNLSGNQLDTLIADYLPKKLEKLDISHNKLPNLLDISINTIPYLKELNASYNQLTSVHIGEPLFRIIVSHNNVTSIGLNHENIHYLDISYNRRLSNRIISIVVSKIDTLVRDSILNNKPIHDFTKEFFNKPTPLVSTKKSQ